MRFRSAKVQPVFSRTRLVGYRFECAVTFTKVTSVEIDQILGKAAEF